MANGPDNLISTNPTAAGLAISVGLDPAQLAAIEQELGEMNQGLPRVLTRAVNKVAVGTRTRIVRRVAGQVNLKVSDLKNRNVHLTRANYSTLAARIYISGRRVPLKRWGARQTRAGVSYAITRGARQTLAGAFLSTMKSGHVGAFIRRERGERLGWGANFGLGYRAGRVGRLPIVELFGPSVPQVVQNIDEFARDTLEQDLADKLSAEVDTQLGLVLSSRLRISELVASDVNTGDG